MTRRRLVTRVALAGLAMSVVAPLSGEATELPEVRYPADYEYGFQGEGTAVREAVDRRSGRVTPTDVQHEAVRRLGAGAFWSPLGTPRTLYKSVGFLTPPRAGAAADVARAFVVEHAALLGLRAELTTPERLELLADNPLWDGPDRRRVLQGLTPTTDAGDVGHAVLFRQRFDGDLFAGQDGLLIVGVDARGRVAHVSSSVTGFDEVRGSWTLSPQQAIVAAAADVSWDVALDAVKLVSTRDGIGMANFTIPGAKGVQRVRRVVMPLAGEGVRLTYEVLLSDPVSDHRDHLGHESDMVEAYTIYVDAETGHVWVRNNDVDHYGAGVPAMSVRGQVVVDPPRWWAFGNIPAMTPPGVATPDTRLRWCWAAADDCVHTGHNGGDREVASPYPYDEVPPGAVINGETGVPAPVPPGPSLTSIGNNAVTHASYINHAAGDVPYSSQPDPTRQYDYAWTDQYHASNCNLTGNLASAQRNDIDASISNLFFGHNRMHDWSYFLGFTASTWNLQMANFSEDDPNYEQAKAGDPEMGNAQAGAAAGSVVFTGRDNANQSTMADGVPGITNQYLWTPLQAGFYSPCVDGAFDMTIIAHEYTHATSNRMIGGPDQGIVGNEGGAMGESWSDLAAMEYNMGYGLAPVGAENPYAVGPYATGSLQNGIRNYGMNDSPLNYGNLDYDGNGATSNHSDGEIWSATQFAVRQALVEKYDKLGFASTDRELQFRCAEGMELVEKCPGNRRWVQLLYDAFLLQDAGAGMSEAALANIAADKIRFGEANHKEMWTAYASRGLGHGADIAGTVGWETPPELDLKASTRVDEAIVQMKAVAVDGGGVPDVTNVYVGRYEANATESFVSKKGAFSSAVKMVPGTYEFIAAAPGYGHLRFTQTLEPGADVKLTVPMRRNHASLAHGGKADGDGGNFDELVDDTETTNWAFLGEPTDNVAEDNPSVTVALAGGRQLVEEVQVSAANRAEESSNAYDAIPQSRFASLRQFEILTCDTTTGATCADEADYTSVYVSAEDAFPSGRPRPTAPTLQIRPFDLPATYATHVRLKVLHNQCTGNPLYTDEANPIGAPEQVFHNPDCVAGFTYSALTDRDPDYLTNSTQKQRVRVSELQVFSSAAPAVGSDGATPIPPARPRPHPRPRPAPLPATGADPVPFVAAALLAGTSAALLRSRRRGVGAP